MIFKNLIIYRITREDAINVDEMEQRLSEMPFTPCGSQELSRFGWVSPLGKNGLTLVHAAGNHLLIQAKKEEKIIPPSVIQDELAEKVEAIEQQEGRAVKRKEKDALRDEVINDLLPRAFSRYQSTYAWINLDDGYIAIDASSYKRAEDVLALLRKCLGSLPVVPLCMATPPELTMTDWFKLNTPPAGFALEDEAELKSALEHGGIIKAKHQDLNSDEMMAHIDADKLVTSLALNWADTVSFVMKDDMSIKRLRFSDELKEQNDDVNEDAAARFDADFALTTGELSRFIKELIEVVGGEGK